MPDEAAFDCRPRCCVAARYREASSLREDLEWMSLDEAASEAASIMIDILLFGCPSCRAAALRELAALRGRH